MSVEEYDTHVIQIGNVYLVAVAYEDTKVCRLSENIYDGIRVPEEEVARKLARMVSGKAVKFNPVTGKVMK